MSEEWVISDSARYVHDLRTRLAEWQRHGVKVTEDCEMCEGSGVAPSPHFKGLQRDCPDCGGTGKKLRDGVRIKPESEWAVNGHFVIFPAEWLEAE